MTKLTVAFRIFANAPKYEITFLHVTFAFDKVMNFFFRYKYPAKICAHAEVTYNYVEFMFKNLELRNKIEDSIPVQGKILKHFQYILDEITLSSNY
jgi:hypothetical protein